MASPSFWRGRRVLVTGHTGFKGAWLCSWLELLGADIVGLGLPPAEGPSLFVATGLDRRLAGQEGDIRDARAVLTTLRTAAPEVVFHLAAQPLVFDALEEPRVTFATNLMGTVNLLDAVRACPSVKALVVVTSDKCYRDLSRACVEDDPLGGGDPYSASKACAELAAAAYRQSYLAPENGIGVATARAGNVIGGGDFARRRLIPDLVSAGLAGATMVLRHPDAIRPWQHVLDALAGYLALAEALVRDAKRAAGAWNFGPPAGREWTVGEIADEVLGLCGQGDWQAAASRGFDEAAALRLDSSRAVRRLDWQPRLDLETALRWTVEGYRILHESGGAEWVRAQIRRYDAAPPLRTVSPVITPAGGMRHGWA